MGILTVAEVVTLLAALIGQTGTIVGIIKDLHEKGLLPTDHLPAEHQAAIAASIAKIQAITTASVEPGAFMESRAEGRDV